MLGFGASKVAILVCVGTRRQFIGGLAIFEEKTYLNFHHFA
jgi:hypothetical protein